MDKSLIHKHSEELPPQLPSLSPHTLNKSSKSKRKKLYCFQVNRRIDCLVVNNDVNSEMSCILCHSSFLGFKKSNCQRHYESHHRIFSNKTYM